MNRNDLDLILGRRNRNCCIMENLRYVFCCKRNIFINLCWITKTLSETSNKHSHKHMLTLNANLDCQVRVIRKIFAFTKTWKYITKLHDPNKKKMGLPYFDWTWLLNGMKMPWYSVCSFFFFFFLFRTNINKGYLDESDFRHCYGIFFKSAILKVTWTQLWSMFLLNNYEAHLQQHFERQPRVENFTDMDLDTS